ncbi:MAG TPA: nucleotidyl transferase AbiEii/AbiGii toxin family protein [Candidatus Binatia bacterium]|nr:nucleotidyl transferase AbiEii/AbiGii toxin family protein [Candidatus Binatia bacterium]
MFEALLAKLGRGLDGRGIPYMLIGGQAVLLYGEPRLTRDIDVTIGAGPERLSELLEFVREAGWRVLPDRPDEFVARNLVLPSVDPASGIRIDLIFSLSPYERQAVARARVVEVNGVPVRYATVEDLIVHKLFAGRPRDMEDARTILLKNPALDKSYVRRWLGEFGPDASPGMLEAFEAICAAPKS